MCIRDRYKEEKTVLDVKVKGIVNAGVIAYVEGIRGFIPASKLSLNLSLIHIYANIITAAPPSTDCGIMDTNAAIFGQSPQRIRKDVYKRQALPITRRVIIRPATDTLRGSASWFDQHIDDWIIWLPTTKGFYSPDNIKKVHAYGVETQVDYAVVRCV